MNKWVRGPGPRVKPGVSLGMSEAVRTRFMALPTTVRCHTDEPERRRPLWLSLRRSVGPAVACHVCRRPAPGGVRLRRRRPGPARPARRPQNPWAPPLRPYLGSGSLPQVPQPVSPRAGGEAGPLQERVLPFSSGSGAEVITAAGRARGLLTPARATEHTRGCRRRPAGVALTAASSRVAARGAGGRAGAGRWEEPGPPGGARDGGGRRRLSRRRRVPAGLRPRVCSAPEKRRLLRRARMGGPAT